MFVQLQVLAGVMALLSVLAVYDIKKVILTIYFPQNCMSLLNIKLRCTKFVQKHGIAVGFVVCVWSLLCISHALRIAVVVFV